MRPYLDPAAAADRPGVVAVGIAQEFQRVFTGYDRRKNGSSQAPSFTFTKTDRRVSVFYFYLWDGEFGPAFIKVCSYFPYPMKICLLTELRAGLLPVTGQMPVRVATVPARDRIRRAVTGSQRVGGASAWGAAGERGSVRAVPAA